MWINELKVFVLGVIGAIGGFISYQLGGWNDVLTILIIFMLVDYVLGVVCAISNKSLKTENGGLSSKAGFNGLLRKGLMFLVVFLGAKLDTVIGSNFIMEAVVIAYILNETISIIENLGILGVPIPSIINKVIDILKKKEQEIGGDLDAK